MLAIARRYFEGREGLWVLRLRRCRTSVLMVDGGGGGRGVRIFGGKEEESPVNGRDKSDSVNCGASEDRWQQSHRRCTLSV